MCRGGVMDDCSLFGLLKAAAADAAEDMRAKCEKIARDEYDRERLPVFLAAARIADAIAALATKP